LLSSIFRTIHTIKGTSGFLAFNRLEKVTHVGESLLSRLRDGTQSMTPDVTNALLLMVDVVRTLLASIEESSAEGDADIEPAITAVTRCMDNADVAPPAAAAAAAAIPVAPAPAPRAR